MIHSVALQLRAGSQHEGITQLLKLGFTPSMCISIRVVFFINAANLISSDCNHSKPELKRKQRTRTPLIRQTIFRKTHDCTAKSAKNMGLVFGLKPSWCQKTITDTSHAFNLSQIFITENLKGEWIVTLTLFSPLENHGSLTYIPTFQLIYSSSLTINNYNWLFTNLFFFAVSLKNVTSQFQETKTF